MKNIKKVLKLDLLAIYPYLTVKNLFLLIGLSITYALMSKQPIIVVSMTQLFTLLFSAYPFMVGEEAGIDPLYRIFNIHPKDVVKGRYLVAILFVGLMLVVGIALTFILSWFNTIEELLSTLGVIVPLTFLVTTFIIFMQYPIYFKYGYSKGKIVANTPFFMIGIVAFFSKFFEDIMKDLVHFFILNKELGLGLVVAIWLLSLLASYQLSSRFYAEREL